MNWLYWVWMAVSLTVACVSCYSQCAGSRNSTEATKARLKYSKNCYDAELDGKIQIIWLYLSAVDTLSTENAAVWGSRHRSRSEWDEKSCGRYDNNCTEGMIVSKGACWCIMPKDYSASVFMPFNSNSIFLCNHNCRRFHSFQDVARSPTHLIVFRSFHLKAIPDWQ